MFLALSAERLFPVDTYTVPLYTFRGLLGFDRVNSPHWCAAPASNWKPSLTMEWPEPVRAWAPATWKHLDYVAPLLVALPYS